MGTAFRGAAQEQEQHHPERPNEHGVAGAKISLARIFRKVQGVSEWPAFLAPDLIAWPQATMGTRLYTDA